MPRHPDSPLDEPVPPPMENQPQPDPPNRKVGSFEIDSLLWWKKSGIWIVGIFAVMGFLVFPQPRHGGRKKATQTQAINNARQIGLALHEFQERYGKLPDASTIAVVRQKAATDLNLGTKSANDFFRQLFATEIVGSEAMFYAKIAGTHKPDNIFTKAEALKKGECGFAYFMGVPTKHNPSRPLAAAPMIPGTDRFDPKPFDGRAVFLKSDNSVTTLRIDKEGHVRMTGINLMDPQHPIWEDKPPVIAWPDL